MNRDVEELGAKVLQQWAMLGAYDFVNIVEAPDAATIARSRSRWLPGSAKLESFELIEIDDLLQQLLSCSSSSRDTPHSVLNAEGRVNGDPAVPGR